MKVILVNPRTDDMIATEVPSYVSKELGFFPPLGLLYLAGAVRAGGRHTVQVVDMPAERMSYEQLGELLGREKPGMVGITGITHNLVEIVRTADCAKNADRGILVCLGGPHVDAFPEESLSFPSVDYAFRGESEKSFVQFLDALDDGKSYESIPGLCFRLKEKVVMNPPVPPENLDSLPFPARDMVKQENYYYVLGKRSSFTTLITSRGCPFKCIFCSTPHGKHRVRSPENIVNEIEEARRGGAEEFHFVDDTFNVQPGRLEAVSAAIIKRGMKIKWSFRGRADNISEDALKQAAAAGCVRMHLGVEAGTDEGMRFLKKGITTAQVEKAVSIARRCGITTAAYFLIGSPHEKTREDVMQTVDFACRANPDFAMFNILAIYPDTELFRMAVEKGLLDGNYWRDFALKPRRDFEIKFWQEHFSPAELMDLLQVAYRKFYLRFSVILRNLKSLNSFDELRHKAVAGLSILFCKSRS